MPNESIPNRTFRDILLEVHFPRTEVWLSANEVRLGSEIVMTRFEYQVSKTGSWPSVVPIAAPRRTPASFRLTIPQFKEPDFAFGLTDKKWYDAIDAQPPVLSSTAASLSAKTSPAPAPASVDGAGGGPSVVKTETPNSQVSVGDKRAPSHSAPSIVTSAVRPPPPKRRPFDLKATEAERKRRKYILKNFTPAEYHNNICKYCKVNEGCNRFAIDHWGDDGEA